MNRRDAIKFATSFAFATALGKYDALAQEAGMLTVDLNQWRGVSFKFRGKTILVPTAEIFAALQESK